MAHKKFLFIPLLILSGLGVWGQPNLRAGTTRWVIRAGSSLQVNGSTNVNKFSCDIVNYDHADTLVVCRTGKGVFISGSIQPYIQSFDCHNAMMTHDLRKALKEKQFPKLHIIFLSFSTFPDLTAVPAFITGWVDITLTGITKRLQINYQVSVDAQNVIHLVGCRDLNFSDFNLVPPKRLGGMVRAKDKLSVVFNLKMKNL
jgi:hypothetical protein